MINIMPCRTIHLEQALRGYQKTGIPLIEYTDHPIPFSAADDMGIYVLIPKLATLLGLRLDTAITYFFYGIAWSAWAVGMLGFFFLYRANIQRLIACIGSSLLTAFALKIGDTYLLYVAPVVALVPWALYWFSKPYTHYSFVFYTCAGFIIALAHYIRAHAALPVLVFVSCLFATKSAHMHKKILAALCLCVGLALPVAYFTHSYTTYTAFVQAEKINNPFGGIRNHLVWHAIYAGLGFLAFKNPDNIRWGDPYPLQKAQSIKPGVAYNTPEYEATLKQEVLNVAKKHPAFVLMTIAAKLGVLLVYLLVFANIGLVAALLRPKQWHVETAFWASLAASSIFPILVLPIPQYSLGFIACAALYGIVSTNALFVNSN